MTKVALFREDAGAEEAAFRAMAVRKQAMGRTAGEALDALTAQLPSEEGDTLIIVRRLGPDRLFTAKQRQRLEQLMASWRLSRETGDSLPVAEQSELEQLIDAELRAATERAAALGRELAR
jgi:hypothetical protein